MSIHLAESYHSEHHLAILLTVDSHQVNTYLPYCSKQDLQVVVINTNILVQIDENLTREERLKSRDK
jgi:hypothetical protein